MGLPRLIIHERPRRLVGCFRLVSAQTDRLFKRPDIWLLFQATFGLTAAATTVSSLRVGQDAGGVRAGPGRLERRGLVWVRAGGEWIWGGGGTSAATRRAALPQRRVRKVSKGPRAR